jgi:hypothetical protein
MTLTSHDSNTGLWSQTTDKLACCAYAPNMPDTPAEEVQAAECDGHYYLNCGTSQAAWGGASGVLYKQFNLRWKERYESVVRSVSCDSSTDPATPEAPELISPAAEVSAMRAYQDLMFEHSFIPVVLACLIIFVGPILAVFNTIRPEPLTSFGRGYSYNIHLNARTIAGFNAVALFMAVLFSWQAYGENGNAIELVMLEVNGLTSFIVAQLGEASGSLAQALDQVNYLNTEYADFDGGFYRNPDCPNTISGQTITDDMCYEALTAKPEYLSQNSLQSVAAFRYGGPPAALVGDMSYCKAGWEDSSNPTGPEMTEYVFCQTQLLAFYGMAHLLAGYPGEGRVFEPNQSYQCCSNNAMTNNCEFSLEEIEGKKCVKGTYPPYLVSDEITSLLTTLETESKNAESYAELGKQMIETIMRMRQILVYFMNQIALVAAALTAAGCFRSDKKLIKSGGWCALIGLVIALFSFSINKPIAVMVTESVEVLVRAGNDMSSLTPEEQDMPLVQILAYCKPADEDDGSSGIDLTFASDLANAISGSEEETATTPAAVKLSIEAATQTMDGLLVYFQSSPYLIGAMAKGVELIPVINNIFDAVRNIVSIIDCGVAFTYFEKMIDILDAFAVPTFKAIADGEITLCFFLMTTFILSRITAYILERPRKIWFCDETGRWFRFKCAYNAHVSLYENKKKAGVKDIARKLGRMAMRPLPSFHIIDIAMAIAQVFHVTLFVILPNAFMAMGGAGFRGVPGYVPYSMLATSISGWASSAVGQDHKSKRAGCMIFLAVLMALVSALSCLLAMFVQLNLTYTCYQVFTDAQAAVLAAEEAGETVSYADALTEAQNAAGEDGEPVSCTFTDLSDYAQSMIFCLVNFLMTFICFISGLAYLYARKSMLTDDVRKTVMKATSAQTNEGKMNTILENMGGERGDGLDNNTMTARQYWGRFKKSAQFKILLAGGCCVGGFLVFKTMTDLGGLASEDVGEAFKFAECSGAGCCNGLTSNCDRKINEVTFAGIHNSMSNGEDGWLTPNNRFSHLGALKAGYRSLMIDIHLYDEDFDASTPDKLHACHGLCSFGKRTATAEFNITKVWLDENPNEVIQIFFENPDGYAGDYDLWQEFEAIGWNDMLVEKKWVDESDHSKGYTWPTLGECIANNKRIMVMKFAGCDPEKTDVAVASTGLMANVMSKSDGKLCPAGYHNAFQVSYDTPYHLTSIHDTYKTVGGVHGADCVDDPCTYSTDIQIRGGLGFMPDNFYIVNHFITPPLAAFALDMNKFDLITDRIESLELEMCERVGVFAIDFWSVGDLGPVKAAQWNNKRPVPTCTKTAVHADPGAPTKNSEGYFE